MNKIGNATLYNDDCKTVMQQLPPESVNAIITDPPYECSTTVITRKKQKNLDSNFGKWDKFDTSWLKYTYRILKQNATLIVFVPATRFETLTNAATAEGLEYVQPWFWHRTNPAVSFRNVLQWSVEHMIYFRKGKHQLAIENRGKCHNLFDIPTTTRNRLHPTQKPIALMSKIIQYATQEGDMVLDPFNGAGSTGIAAVSHNRKYIGIEQNKEYYEKTLDRFKREISPYDGQLD
jgi:site-specific DNA-methyltransferase (adenine-specific)